MYVILYVKCSVLFTYQTNCNILRTKSDMKKTIDGVPLSFQEFFQCTLIFMYTLITLVMDTY